MTTPMLRAEGKDTFPCLADKAILEERSASSTRLTHFVTSDRLENTMREQIASDTALVEDIVI